jgi:hypothetical protein
MDKSKLRNLIFNEMKKIIQDDAIFREPDMPGVLDSFDFPDDQHVQHGEDWDNGRNLSYGHLKSTDREGSMTKKQLYYIARRAQSLHDLLRDDDDLPEWVQSKIARVSDKIQTVYEYIEHKIKTGNY